jgi:hypothetical protein
MNDETKPGQARCGGRGWFPQGIHDPAITCPGCPDCAPVETAPPDEAKPSPQEARVHFAERFVEEFAPDEAHPGHELGVCKRCHLTVPLACQCPDAEWNADPAPPVQEARCETCDGKGRIGRVVCPACGGTGTMGPLFDTAPAVQPEQGEGLVKQLRAMAGEQDLSRISGHERRDVLNRAADRLEEAEAELAEAEEQYDELLRSVGGVSPR